MFHVLKVRVNDELLEALKRGAKAKGVSVQRFASIRLALDRYDLVTEQLIKEGHVSVGRCANETVL